MTEALVNALLWLIDVIVSTYTTAERRIQCARTGGHKPTTFGDGSRLCRCGRRWD